MWCRGGWSIPRGRLVEVITFGQCARCGDGKCKFAGFEGGGYHVFDACRSRTDSPSGELRRLRGRRAEGRLRPGRPADLLAVLCVVPRAAEAEGGISAG